MEHINRLIQHGMLEEAISECIGGVKKNPTDIPHRVSLYELSAFAGDWKRCVNQVETIVQLGGDALHWAGHMAHLHAEKNREAFWASPSAFAPPIMGGDDYAHEIAKSLTTAKQSPPAMIAHAEEYGGLDFGACIINDTSYTSLRLVDSRLCAFLEAIEHGEYVWIYAGAIRHIDLALSAGDLTHRLWIPAKIVLSDNSVRVCSLCGLYPSTHQSADPKVKLGQHNEWLDLAEDVNVGRGPVLLAADQTIIPLIQANSLAFAESDETDNTIE